jgi:hypothetical protein
MHPKLELLMAVITLLLVCLFSVALIVLKLVGVLAITWVLALCPVPIFVMGFILYLGLANLFE